MITSTLKYWIGLKVPLVLKLKNLKLLTVFVWSKKHVVLCYPDGRLCIFCWLIPDTFPWLLLSVGLIRRSTYWNCLVFQKELIIEDSLPTPPYKQTSPSLDEDWTLVWLVVVHFTCSMISSVPHYITVSTFHHLSKFTVKVECFQ